MRQDASLVIKPSDKGGNIVVQDSEDYRAMGLRVLRDKDTKVWKETHKKIPRGIGTNFEGSPR